MQSARQNSRAWSNEKKTQEQAVAFACVRWFEFVQQPPRLAQSDLRRPALLHCQSWLAIFGRASPALLIPALSLPPAPCSGLTPFLSRSVLSFWKRQEALLLGSEKRGCNRAEGLSHWHRLHVQLRSQCKHNRIKLGVHHLTAYSDQIDKVSSKVWECQILRHTAV